MQRKSLIEWIVPSKGQTWSWWRHKALFLLVGTWKIEQVFIDLSHFRSNARLVERLNSESRSYPNCDLPTMNSAVLRSGFGLEYRLNQYDLPEEDEYY